MLPLHAASVHQIEAFTCVLGCVARLLKAMLACPALLNDQHVDFRGLQEMLLACLVGWAFPHTQGHLQGRLAGRHAGLLVLSMFHPAKRQEADWDSPRQLVAAPGLLQMDLLGYLLQHMCQDCSVLQRPVHSAGQLLLADYVWTCYQYWLGDYQEDKGWPSRPLEHPGCCYALLLLV